MPIMESFALLRKFKEDSNTDDGFPQPVAFDGEKYILSSMEEERVIKTVARELKGKGYLIAKIKYDIRKHTYMILELFPEEN
ncbi:MAG: hypothetical protein PHQ95_01185 [Candidatus Gracilibacteria bacterium]|nr:hypothetical protein [Candidatus Gracilibacteria bacterium]